MGLSNAFGDVNRTLLWDTLYKRAPIPTIQQIAQGHQNTKLGCGEMGAYGKDVENNIGVFQAGRSVR